MHKNENLFIIYCNIYVYCIYIYNINKVKVHHPSKTLIVIHTHSAYPQLIRWLIPIISISLELIQSLISLLFFLPFFPFISSSSWCQLRQINVTWDNACVRIIYKGTDSIDLCPIQNSNLTRFSK